MSVNYIALAIPIFLLFIAIEVVVARRLRLEVYRFNDAVTDLGCGIGQQVIAVFLKGSLLAGYVYLFERFALFRFDEGSPVPWLVAFLGVDFLYYWWHRASHEVAFLWAVHVVHHQSEDYNLAVALRQAWFSGLSSWLFYLPLAFIGIPPLVFVTTASFSTLYQFWIHTRTIGTLGPLEAVLNTPSHHRVHHGRNPKYLDRNYAATLIVWDRLFGTFQREEDEPVYGVVEPYASWNPIWANFDYWAHLGAKTRAASRPLDKLHVWIRPPGWAPPGSVQPVLGLAGDEPPVRFATPACRPVNLYIAAQFLPVVAATAWLMVADLGRLTPRHVAVAAVVLAAVLAWGGLFERKPWATAVEAARLVAVGVLSLALVWSGDAHPALAGAILLFSVASGVWLGLARRASSGVEAPAGAAA